MAIDNRPLNNNPGPPAEPGVLNDVTDVNTTEFLFRRGMTDTLEQVNTTQTHMAANRTFTITGDVTTSSVPTWQWNDTNDYAMSVSITLNDGVVGTAEIAANAVTAAKIADGAIDSPTQIVDGQVTSAKIPNGSRVNLQVLDTGGGVLFNGDCLTT